MNPLSNSVRLHPYFEVHPGKLDAFKSAFPAFVKKTKREEKNHTDLTRLEMHGPAAEPDNGGRRWHI